MSERERPLRVGVLAPISWRVPPRGYGPWELFASLLTEGLVERGHDVTLFATADSLTSARLVPSAPRGYSEDPALDAKVWECLHIAGAFERASELDVLHNGFDFLPLTYSRLVDTPVVTTIHGFSSDRILPVYERYDGHTHYVSISDADRRPSLHYEATIHHGIDMRDFSIGASERRWLLFLGRIHPDKGTAEAIETARRADLPLVIAGIVQDAAYFDREVAPRLGERVRFVGPVEPERRAALFAGAIALLHLVNFDEPFGFAVVEAMASGTPVIATSRGSMPEIIEPGVNGFLVGSIDDAVGAVQGAAGLDPATVRASVERRFDRARMVDAYVEVYRRVLARRRIS